MIALLLPDPVAFQALGLVGLVVALAWLAFVAIAAAYGWLIDIILGPKDEGIEDIKARVEERR